MVAKKDFNAPKHPELDTVPNLMVIKAMQVSCVRRDFISVERRLGGRRERVNSLGASLGANTARRCDAHLLLRWSQSLKSRGYVHEQYAWRHFYWSLTNEGMSCSPAPARTGRPVLSSRASMVG